MRRHRLVGSALLVPLVIALVLAGRWPATGDPLPEVRHVIVVAAPGLALRELRDGELRQVALGGGAVGAMSVRAQHTRPDAAEGYLALGSGIRTRSVPEARDGEVVFGAAARTALPAPVSVPVPARTVGTCGGCRVRHSRVASIDALRAANRGRRLGSACGGCRVRHGRVAAIDALRAANRGRRLGSAPGALASALHDAGRDVVVVGDGPVALAGMDRDGRVAVARGALPAIAREHDVVIAAAPDPAAADRLLRMTPPRDTLVMLVSVSPARDGQLTPAAVLGSGVAPGRLVSVSTRRDGLVTLADVAPTILGVLGVAPPPGMDGRTLRTRPGVWHLDRLLDLDARSARQATAYRPLVYTAAALLIALVALSLAGARRPATALALAVAALPLATYLMRLVPNAGSDLVAVGLTALVAGALAAAAGGLTHSPRGALTAVLCTTAGVLAIDGATGGWLHTTTMLGYSLPGGGRFYGMPNSTFAVLAAATVLAAGLAVERHGRDVLPAVAVGFAVVALLNCLPGLGSDVGGLLTLTPVFGLAWLGLTGRRVRARHVAALAAAALVLLVGLAALDLLRPDAERTHLGRLLAEMLHDGAGPLGDAIVRKQSANLQALAHSAWSAGLIVVAGAALALRTPLSAPLRAATAATLLLAAVGFALNDSGPVVIALVLFFLAPLLAVCRVDAEPAVTRARGRGAAPRRASPG